MKTLINHTFNFSA